MICQNQFPVGAGASAPRVERQVVIAGGLPSLIREAEAMRDRGDERIAPWLANLIALASRAMQKNVGFDSARRSRQIPTVRHLSYGARDDIR